MYFIYVLKSRSDGKYYYGLSKDVQVRLAQHNGGQVKSTKGRMPFDLVYFEKADTLVAARKREKYFKSGFGRKYVQSKIKALSSIG